MSLTATQTATEDRDLVHVSRPVAAIVSDLAVGLEEREGTAVLAAAEMPRSHIQVRETIRAALAETHQSNVTEDDLDRAAEIVSAPGYRFENIDLTAHRLGVWACLNRYDAALKERADPSLTVERLQRQAFASNTTAEYHEKHAVEYAGRAEKQRRTGEVSFAGELQLTADAHQRLAAEKRAEALQFQITAETLAARLAPKAA